MVTIKEVATEAGVSIATVSYYLNNKSVSEKKAKKIAEAIKKLNYIVSSSGRNLRKINQDIGVVFPNIYDPYLEKIIHGIKGYLQYQECPIILELTDDDPEKETDIIHELIGKKVSGILLYTCQPNNADLFSIIEASGIPLMLIDRKPLRYDGNFISPDNFSLFRDLTCSLMDRGRRNILLVCGPLEFRENSEAHRGFCEGHTSRGLQPEKRVIVSARSIRESGFRAGVELLRSEPSPPDAILTTSYKLAEGLRYALELNRIRVGETTVIICTGDSVNDVFYNDRSIVKTSRHAFEIGETAARILLQNSKSPKVFEPQQIIVRDPEERLISSFSDPGRGRDPITAEPPRKKNELKILLIDDPDSVYALQQLLIDFQERENMSVRIEKVLPEHLYEYIIKNLSRLGSSIDAFLFDIPWLEFLVRNEYFLCLDRFLQEYEVELDHYIPGILESYGKVDGRCFALPYMCCTQILYYRKDLFRDDFLKRKFEERYKIPLEPPKSWVHYLSIAEFFSRSGNSHSPTEYGNALDIAYTEEIMGAFYPRLWAYKGRLFERQGLPVFNSIEARNALKNLVECSRFAHPDLFRDRPVGTVNKLLNGDVAMAVTYHNYATGIADRSLSPFSGKIGWAMIPGAAPILGGWSFGISRFSSQPEAAFKFITWASCRELAVPHTILGGQSPSLQTYQNYDLVSLYPWLPNTVSSFAKARARRIPQGGQYSEKQVEDALAVNIQALVRKAVDGYRPNGEDIEKTLLGAELLLKNHHRTGPDSLIY